MNRERGRDEKTPVLWMVVHGVIASAIGIAVGLAIEWFPEQASTQAGPVDHLYDVLIWASVPVFVTVTIIVLFSVRNFQMRPGEEQLDGPPIHGNTRLEVIWTAIPAIILVVLCSYSWVVLNDIEEAQANEMRINVVGQQFAWTFEYPQAGGKPIKSNQLYLPKDQPGALLRQGAGRHPRLLGTGVPHEGRRRAGHRDEVPRHAQPPGHLPGRLRRAVRPRPLGHALDRRTS